MPMVWGDPRLCLKSRSEKLADYNDCLHELIGQKMNYLVCCENIDCFGVL